MITISPRSLLASGLMMALLLATPARSQTAPPGAVIDLGTGTPSTVDMYTQYSTTVTAQTSGLYYSLFAFREVPAFFRFDDASVTAVGSTTNLLVNPGFEDGSTPGVTDSDLLVPNGWGVVYQTGTPPGAAGTVDTGSPHSGSYVWDDGSVESFDGLYQTFAATAGQQYVISFFLSADDPFSTPTIETAAYFGACNVLNSSCATDLGNGFSVAQPSSPTIDTTNGDIAPNVFSLGSPAATANTVTFVGGTLRMTGGTFADNIITAPVVLTSSNGTVDTSTGSGGFSGVVSGPGSLTIIGSNTFSLSSANTYSGGTFLSGGTLLVGDNAALGTGPLTMADGTTLKETVGVTLLNAAILSGRDTFETSDTTGEGEGLIYTGAISGTGTLVKTGASGLRLSAANTYSGGTILAAGHIGIDNDAALGTGPVTFAGGFLRAHASGYTIANAAVLSSDGRIDTRAFDLTYAGAISGEGQLIKTGSGTLLLTNFNSYSGGTALNGGTIAVTNNSALGTGALSFNGGALRAAADGLTLANDATLASNGTVDTQGFGLALAGYISGPGQLTKTGAGTLAPTNYNSYGGGTVIQAGTVQVSASYYDPDTAALLRSARQQPSTHQDLPDSVTLVNNGGTIASSIGYGPITLDGGTLQFAGTASSLANQFIIGPGGGTIDSGGQNALTLHGGLVDAANGTGPLVFTNTGAGRTPNVDYDFFLFRSSSFTGGSIIRGNTYVLSDSNDALGVGSLQVDFGGTFDLAGFDQAVTRLSGGGRIVSSGYADLGLVNTLTVQSGAFSGDLQDGTDTDTFNEVTSRGLLALTKASDGTASGGTLVLSGVDTYSGPTTIAGGTLQAGSTTALSPNSAVAVAGGATLDLNAFSNTVGSLAGAGTVTNTGATAATLTAGGTNASTTFSGLLADGAAPLALTKTGTGTLSLTSPNTYSGGTTVLAGTLGIGNSAALGSGPVALHDLTELQFLADGLTLGNAIALTATDPTIDTGPGNQTISGPITGPGALTKIGSGSLDLTGANTYTGATEVAAGTLLVDGAIVNSTITVDSGAALGGSGTIRDFIIDGGATLAPSASATLKTTGNGTFLTGSTYRVTVNADGTNSKLSIGGTADLSGATLSVLAGGGTFHAATYTLLTAGSLGGTRFAGEALASSLTLFNPTVNYDATDVTLTLSPADLTSFAVTPNQAAVAAAIQALGPTSPLYQAVVRQDAAGAQQAFAAASGVSQASTTSIVATNTRLTTGLVIDRLWDVSGSGLSAQQVLDQFAPDRLPALVRCYGPVPDPVPAPPAPTYTAWGEAFGTFGHTDAGANAGSQDRSLGGFILGIDTPLGDAWRGGIAGGYTNTAYKSHLDGGTGTVQGVFGSLYGGARYGAVDIRVGTTVGGTFIDARRNVSFNTFFEQERSSNTGYTVQTFGEVGYRIPAQGVVIEPIAGAAFLHSHQDAFSEKGGAAALTVGAIDTDLGTTTLGFRSETQPFKDIPTLVLHTFLAWQHVIGDVSPATTLAFEAAPANSFSVTGTPIDRDALAAEVAVDYRVNRALDLGLSYTGLIGKTAEDHSVKGRVEYRF